MTTIANGPKLSGNAPDDMWIIGQRVGQSSAESLAINQLSKLTYLENAVTINVGSGGDYATVGEALEEASKYRTSHSVSTPEIRVIINLLSGFVWAEQVFLIREDFSHVNITSEDATVTVTRSALTTSVTNWIGADRYPVIFGLYSKMFVLDCLLSMDTSGTATDRDGLRIYGGHMIITTGNGVINCGGVGISAYNGSNIIAASTLWTGCSIGVTLYNSSVGVFNGATVSNADVHNFVVGAMCLAYATGLIADGAGQYGVVAEFGGRGDFHNSFINNQSLNGSLVHRGGFADFTDCDMRFGGGYAVVVTTGSQAVASGANSTGRSGGGVFISEGAYVVARAFTGTFSHALNTIVSGVGIIIN